MSRSAWNYSSTPCERSPRFGPLFPSPPPTSNGPSTRATSYWPTCHANGQLPNSSGQLAPVSIPSNPRSNIFGCSLFRFGEKARMDYTRQLLLENKRNVTKVALHAGYPNGRSGGGYKQAEMPGILKQLGISEIGNSPFYKPSYESSIVMGNLRVTLAQCKLRLFLSILVLPKWKKANSRRGACLSACLFTYCYRWPKG